MEVLMETLELPVLEDLEQNSPSLDKDIDLDAFLLWREASRLDNNTDEDTPVMPR
jgi:hypothetical protein